MNMTGQNVLQFDCSSEDSNDADSQFERALLSAENMFGPLSGEVGLILAAIIEHHKDNPDKADMIADYQRRIDEIVAIYLADQNTP